MGLLGGVGGGGSCAHVCPILAVSFLFVPKCRNLPGTCGGAGGVLGCARFSSQCSKRGGGDNALVALGGFVSAWRPCVAGARLVSGEQGHGRKPRPCPCRAPHLTRGCHHPLRGGAEEARGGGDGHAAPASRSTGTVERASSSLALFSKAVLLIFLIYFINSSNPIASLRALCAI